MLAPAWIIAAVVIVTCPFTIGITAESSRSSHHQVPASLPARTVEKSGPRGSAPAHNPSVAKTANDSPIGPANPFDAASDLAVAPPRFYHSRRYQHAHLVSENNSFYGRIRTNSTHTPSVQEHLPRRPFCGHLNWTTPVNGTWFQDTDGHYAFELHACRLRRLNASAAGRCLARVSPIVFIGDSLTRCAPCLMC